MKSITKIKIEKAVKWWGKQLPQKTSKKKRKQFALNLRRALFTQQGKITIRTDGLIDPILLDALYSAKIKSNNIFGDYIYMLITPNKVMIQYSIKNRPKRLGISHKESPREISFLSKILHHRLTSHGSCNPPQNNHYQLLNSREEGHLIHYSYYYAKNYNICDGLAHSQAYHSHYARMSRTTKSMIICCLSLR